jgi:hypothetical protein
MLISGSVHSTDILRKLSWVVSDLICVSEVPGLFLGQSYSDRWSFQANTKLFSIGLQLLLRHIDSG